MSPLHRQKQHQLIRDNPLLTRLSMVRILSQTVVHKRKDTLLGAFIHQILFQGKEALRGPEKKYIYIIKAHIKKLCLSQFPTQRIISLTPWQFGINMLKERIYTLQFPDMKSTVEL